MGFGFDQMISWPQPPPVRLEREGNAPRHADEIFGL
jgi:hypothetical protein